jgi:hypothetical protein
MMAIVVAIQFSQRVCKWTTLLFLHLLDLIVLNSYIIVSYSCKAGHQKLYLALVQSLLEMNTRKPHPEFPCVKLSWAKKKQRIQNSSASNARSNCTLSLSLSLFFQIYTNKMHKL